MKHIRKRVWGTLLCLAMLLSLLPTVALAEEGTSVEYLDPTTGTTQICPSATVVTAGSTAWSSAGGTEEAWYVVNSDVEIASRITVTGNVHLILVDGYTLTAPNGISVTSGNSLTIYGQSADTGALIAGTDGVADDQYSDKAYQAGIGGNRGNTDVYAHGNITINGGSITAYGGFGAAGIGGGFGTTSGVEENGTISINGGTVKAIGGAQAAGIGSGTQNGVAGGDITITGGNVTAQGGEKAAGIGGGQMARDTVGRSITISGGTVNATGGDKAAGIGSGYNAMVDKSINTIKINGSANVTAQGGAGAAGIGSSYEGKITGAIQIGGSANVIANGGNSNEADVVQAAGAGIGSGGGFTGNSTVGKITISGGTVTATGGIGEKIGSSSASYSFSGAGIGSGGSYLAGTSSTNAIVISAGTITANAGGDGADGIGSGAGSSQSGDFSTGTSGKAVIYTDSITDTDTSAWDCIVFDSVKTTGTVYGDVTLKKNLTVKENATLTIPEGASLTVPEDKKLTNNGTVKNNGTMVINSMLGGTGTLNGTKVTLPAEKVTYNGTISFTVEISGRQVTFTTASKDAGEYTCTAGTPGKGQYTVELPDGYVLNQPGTLTITPKPVELEWSKPTSFLYDGDSHSVTAKVTNGIGDDTFVLSYESNTAVNAGTYTAKVTALGNGNYTLDGATGAEQEWSIGKAPLTITADNKTATAGNALPILTYTVEGLVDGDKLDTEPTLTCNANMNQAGTYTIQISGATASNYTIKYVNGTLTVNPLPPFAGHSISVVTDGNGTVSVNPTAAKGGETVTITATPEEGYEVGAITVTSVTGQSVAVTGNKFTMPAASVTVKVTFVKTGAPACPFTDVTEANWYYDEVYYVWANGLMQGTSATTFGPGVDTTRAMVVTILWRLEGEPASGYDMDYSDVAGGAWYAGAVRWATEHGIVNGSEGQFYPGGIVTREQLAAMLYRYAQYKGYDLTAGGDLSGFADAGAVSGWAETSLAWAVGQRLIQGSANQIDPTGSAIRAQLAAILMRFCENVAEV